MSPLILPGHKDTVDRKGLALSPGMEHATGSPSPPTGRNASSVDSDRSETVREGEGHTQRIPTTEEGAATGATATAGPTTEHDRRKKVAPPKATLETCLPPKARAPSTEGPARSTEQGKLRPTERSRSPRQRPKESDQLTDEGPLPSQLVAGDEVTITGGLPHTNTGRLGRVIRVTMQEGNAPNTVYWVDLGDRCEHPCSALHFEKWRLFAEPFMSHEVADKRKISYSYDQPVDWDCPPAKATTVRYMSKDSTFR